MSDETPIQQTGQRAAMIDKIVEKRQPMVHRIQTVTHTLNTLDDAIRELADQSGTLLSNRSEAVLRGDIQQRLSGLRTEIDDTLNILDKLKIRFGRQTINIGVVGRARQGKSRLLRSLTGLSEKVIPDNRGGFCTGVRSKISHSPEQAGNAAAKVRFYSPTKFLDEVISPYYRELELGTAPRSLSALSSDNFPILPEKFRKDEYLKSIYGNLRKKYSGRLNEYISLLEGPPQKEITENEIRSYVTQENANYLAVDEVEVFCKFPQTDVGKISLIDLPGLGDLNLLDEERLIKTLNQEVDFILFVRRPEAMGDAWKDVDVKLYRTARSALDVLPIKRWSFMVLNRLDSSKENQQGDLGDNLQICEQLKESIGKDNHIDVAGCMIVDCSDGEAVQSLILDEILRYLIDHIEELDAQYASFCHQRIARLQEKVSTELTQMGAEIKNYTPELLFEDHFPVLWQNLSEGLGKLIDELRGKCQDVVPSFEAEAQEVISRCREIVSLPSSEEIEQRHHQNDGYSITQLRYIPEIRASLSKQFLYLDGQLQELVEIVKGRVLEVLKESARLENLIDQGQPSQWNSLDDLTFTSRALLSLLDHLPDKQGELASGFKTLARFNVSYSGVIQMKVRPYLDALDPDSPALLRAMSLQRQRTAQKQSEEDAVEGLIEEEDFSSEDDFGPAASFVTAESAQKSLENICDRTITSCEQALSLMLHEPNEVAYAMAREFSDRALRAKGVKKEWRKFLLKNRAEIWPEFKQMANREEKFRQWQSLIRQAITSNQSPDLTLL